MKGLKTLIIVFIGGLVTMFNNQVHANVSDYKVLRPPGKELFTVVPTVEKYDLVNYNKIEETQFTMISNQQEQNYINNYLLVKSPAITGYVVYSPRGSTTVMNKYTNYSLRADILIYRDIPSKKARDGLRCS